MKSSLAIKYTILVSLVATLSACHRTMLINNATTSQIADSRVIASPPVTAMPHVIIYKTARNCDNLVPITLSDDGSRIVSYPDPSDLRIGGQLATPTRLTNGYLLDNRGISRHVAFLSYTYEEYAAMKQAPSMEQLLAHIVDRDPLTEYIDCGPRSGFSDNLTEELNQYIQNLLTPQK